MKLISTRHNSPYVSFIDALWSPKAPDGGLYTPALIPTLPKPVLNNMAEMTLPEMAYVIFNTLLGDEFCSSEIKEIVEDAFNIDVPVVKLNEQISILELFHGPTLAFKDFGARMTARLLQHTFLDTKKKKVNILIFTTGNTGSAMANALAGISDFNIFVVFPRGTASRALENQFTTLGNNIIPIEVNGSIDACRTLVATALHDSELTRNYTLLSVNSENIARVLGQTVYYFYGESRIRNNSKNVDSPKVVALPAGNLGNLTAGIIARKMGLDVQRFIACENTNNYLSRALLKEEFVPSPAVPTLAYAADKSVPTNIERILDLYDTPSPEQILKELIPVTVSDEQIIESINECYERYGYLLDPHSALAYQGLKDNIKPDESGLLLATAHPAKSLTAMTAITGRPVELPVQLNRFMGRPDHRRRIRPNYHELKSIIAQANK